MKRLELEGDLRQIYLNLIKNKSLLNIKANPQYLYLLNTPSNNFFILASTAVFTRLFLQLKQIFLLDQLDYLPPLLPFHTTSHNLSLQARTWKERKKAANCSCSYARILSCQQSYVYGPDSHKQKDWSNRIMLHLILHFGPCLPLRYYPKHVSKTRGLVRGILWQRKYRLFGTWCECVVGCGTARSLLG